MHRISKSRFVAPTWGLALGWILFGCPPAQADQIVALVDEHGHKVYINTGEPRRHPADWMTRGFRRGRPSYPAPSLAQIDRWVEQMANRYQLDPQLIHAIIEVESEYNPSAVSRKGALGLMQLVPETAQRFGVENPFDPRQNIEGGVTYLKYLLDLFGGDVSLSLAAYNAGEHSVLRNGGIPSLAETLDYVRKVTNLYNSGDQLSSAKPKLREPYKAPIYRFVDAQGVVHFTNGDEF